MRNFRVNSIIFISVIAAIFACNVYYLLRLYHSIRADVEREVKTAMTYADMDDLMFRAGRAQGLTSNFRMQEEPESEPVLRKAEASTYQDEDGQLISIRTEVDGTVTEEKVANLSENANFSNQMVEVMSKQFHVTMDKYVAFDVSVMDSVLTNQLAYRNIYPEFIAVEVVNGKDSVICPNPRLKKRHEFDSFRININPYEDIYYKAYLTPLTRHILSQMEGIIITILLLLIAFASAFWYLFHTVQSLRTIEEMKDDFVGNMTHELKTPIAIAYSANDALLNYDTSGNKEKKEAYLKIALNQLRRLNELVEGILAISMEKRKTMTLKSEPICLAKLVNDISMNHRMRTEKKISITTDIPDDILIYSDGNHLSNVINNLIDNAIKYSRDTVDIKIQANGEGLSISDNGIGIPAKNQPFIFNKFYRVPQGNIHNVRGYGIGLYYVKQILTKLGWSITVKSHVGEGSTFHIRFNQDEK